MRLSSYSLPLVLCGLVALGQGGCEGGPDDPTLEDTPDTTPASPTPTVDDTFDIYLEPLGFESTYIHYDDGSGWTEEPGELMTEADGWQHQQWTIDPEGTYGATFAFNDGSSTWYPGGSGNNFRVSDHFGVVVRFGRE